MNWIFHVANTFSTFFHIVVNKLEHGKLLYYESFEHYRQRTVHYIPNLWCFNRVIWKIKILFNFNMTREEGESDAVVVHRTVYITFLINVTKKCCWVHTVSIPLFSFYFLSFQKMTHPIDWQVQRHNSFEAWLQKFLCAWLFGLLWQRLLTGVSMFQSRLVTFC